MAGTFYLNTDLDLVSVEDLTPLAKFLEGKKWSVLHADWHPDGYWLGMFEVPQGRERSPERTIARMLKVIEALPEPHRSGWRSCSKRDFNIGYQSAAGGRRLEQTLSNALLQRMAAVGASISVTIYPSSQSPKGAGP